MSAHAENHEHSGGHSHHIIPQSTLLVTFTALMVLMVATIGAAIYMPEPIRSNSVMMNLIAMGIAVLKAYLVVSIFMGVKWATKLTKLFAIGGFVWFLTLFIALVDYASRPLEPVVGWDKGAPQALPRDPKRQEILR